MSKTCVRMGFRLGLSLLAGGLALALGIGLAAAAERTTAASIIKALTPRPLTRSLSASPDDGAQNRKDEHFIDSVRNKPSPTLTVHDRDQIATIAKRKPNIDLQIHFEFNSARIGRSAQRTVNELGKALTNPTLKGNTFIVGGYADAKGRSSYNQALSERRAQAVKLYLMEKYGISAGKLVTVGYGETHLKDPRHPYAAVNRRVAVANMDDSKMAKK